MEKDGAVGEHIEISEDPVVIDHRIKKEDRRELNLEKSVDSEDCCERAARQSIDEEENKLRFREAAIRLEEENKRKLKKGPATKKE